MECIAIVVTVRAIVLVFAFVSVVVACAFAGFVGALGSTLVISE